MGFLSKLLGGLSGNNALKVSEQLLFDKVIGFRGIVPGCGVSTIVQNVAIALSEKTKFNICVLDTNFLYPVQYPLLLSDETREKHADILDFANDLSKITIPTQYNNVYLVNLSNRTIVDMLSGKDTELIIEKVIGSLKSYFDIVLVDLSQEPTNIAIHSAIKCNKIYQIADTSMKCLYNVKKSINTMVTLAVPLAKAYNVILNKQIPDMLLGVQSAMEEAGLHVLGEIPLSVEIAAACASGKKIYGSISMSKEVTAFNKVIDTIVNDIAVKTPKNVKYFDVNKALSAMDKARADENSTEYVDTVEEADIVDIIEDPDVEDMDNDDEPNAYTAGQKILDSAKGKGDEN